MADAAPSLGTRETARGSRDSAEPLRIGVLRDVLGFHVSLAAVVTGGLFERHIGAPLKLRKAEYSLLMLLLANGATTAKRLARALRLSAPQLTMLLDRLQQRRWLRREPNPVDRRSQLIVLTRDGEALARRAATVSATMERSLLQRLSAAERAMLIELLMKVAAQRDGEPADAET
jgi:DNA-binding MarR family transcriptional regulator